MKITEKTIKNFYEKEHPYKLSENVFHLNNIIRKNTRLLLKEFFIFMKVKEGISNEEFKSTNKKILYQKNPFGNSIIKFGKRYFIIPNIYQSNSYFLELKVADGSKIEKWYVKAIRGGGVDLFTTETSISSVSVIPKKSEKTLAESKSSEINMMPMGPQLNCSNLKIYYSIFVLDAIQSLSKSTLKNQIKVRYSSCKNKIKINNNWSFVFNISSNILPHAEDASYEPYIKLKYIENEKTNYEIPVFTFIYNVLYDVYKCIDYNERLDDSDDQYTIIRPLLRRIMNSRALFQNYKSQDRFEITFKTENMTSSFIDTIKDCDCYLVKYDDGAPVLRIPFIFD